MLYCFYSRIPEIRAQGYKITEYTGSEKDVFFAYELGPARVDRIDGDYFYTQAAGGEIKYLIKDYIFAKINTV
jgi:hypothetical protein